MIHSQIPIKHVLKILSLPVLVFVVLEIAAIITSTIIKNTQQDLSQERLDNRLVVESQKVVSTSNRLLSEYTSALRAARSYFNSSKSVERKDWQTYVTSLETKKNYPAISSLVFIKKVGHEDLNTYEKSIQKELLLQGEEKINFNLRPASDQKNHYFIHYFEPFNASSSAFGFDYASDPSRRQAVEKARDINDLVITEPITLLTDQAEKKSFIMMMPVYEPGLDISTLQNRRKHFIGVIEAIIRAEDFFSLLMLSTQLNDLNGLQVTDTSHESIKLISLMDNLGQIKNQTDNPNSKLVINSQINIGTRTWSLAFYSDKLATLVGYESFIPILSLIRGSILALAVAVTVFNAFRLKSRAETLAHKLNKDLEKFLLAVENVSDHIVITDINGLVLYANPAVEQITGYKQKDVIGKKAGTVSTWGGNMDKKFYEKMWRAIKVNKACFEGVVINKKKNGEPYDASVKIAPVLDADKNILFFVGIERNVTKEKELERAKDEFVSVASHELRTPLTAIDGLISMILDGDYGKVSANLKQPLEDVKISSERLIHLVNDLLNVSRIEAGKLKYELTNFDIKKVIDHEVSLLSIVAQTKGLELSADQVSSCFVRADQDKITQIFNNLIGNALKFTEKGTITVTLKLESGSVHIFVTDTGVGIHENDRSKLFSKFQQLDTGKMRQTGTGLGLYISKKMCQEMGGDLTLVQSEPNQGSTFSFSVPLASKILN